MASKTVHSWTCDRCALVFSNTDPPDDWDKLTGVQLDTPGGDVCFACRCEFQDWWRAGLAIRRLPKTGADGDTPASEVREPVTLAQTAQAAAVPLAKLGAI